MASVIACPSCGRRNRVPLAAHGVPRCAACHTALPWLVEVGDEEFDKVVGEASVPVLVDLWAPWCGPCRMVSPAVEAVGRERAGTLQVVKVNVDLAPGVAARFEARSIPTLLLIDHGQVVARQVGAVPAAQLRAWVDGALARAGRADR